MCTRDTNEYKIFMKQITEIKPDYNNDFELVVISFTKYILELEDAIEALLSKNHSIGLAYVVRGQYEMILQLCYLVWSLKDPIITCDRRARSYMYFNLLRMQEWAGILGKVEDIEIIKTKFLTYTDIKQEHESCKSKYPNWFSLFNGPSSFNELEEYLGFSKGKNSLYNILSKLCHGKVTVRDYFMDTGPSINAFMNNLDTLRKCLVHKLIPFAKCNNIDTNEILSFLNSGSKKV